MWPEPLVFIVECGANSAGISTYGELDLNIEHEIEVETIPHFEIPLNSFKILS